MLLLGACCRLPDSDDPAFLPKIFTVILFLRNWNIERKLKCHFQETRSLNLHKIIYLLKSICKSNKYEKSFLQSSLTRKIPTHSTCYYFPMQKKNLVQPVPGISKTLFTYNRVLLTCFCYAVRIVQHDLNLGAHSCTAY